MAREKRRVRAIKIIWDLATVTSCIGLSVTFVTKSPTVGPLLIFSSLDVNNGEVLKREKNVLNLGFWTNLKRRKRAKGSCTLRTREPSQRRSRSRYRSRYSSSGSRNKY
jgi:hypothetical protein